MTLSIIAAINQKRGIGYQNKLLYWLPNDLKRFSSERRSPQPKKRGTQPPVTAL